MWMGIDLLEWIYGAGVLISLTFALWLRSAGFFGSGHALFGLALILTLVWPLILLLLVWLWFAEIVIDASGRGSGKTKRAK